MYPQFQNAVGTLSGLMALGHRWSKMHHTRGNITSKKKRLSSTEIKLGWLLIDSPSYYPGIGGAGPGSGGYADR